MILALHPGRNQKIAYYRCRGNCAPPQGDLPFYHRLPDVIEQNFLNLFFQELLDNQFDCRKNYLWIQLLVGRIKPTDFVEEEMENLVDGWDEIPVAFLRPCRLFYRPESVWKTPGECEDIDEYYDQEDEPDDPNEEYSLEDLDCAYVAKYASYYQTIWEPMKNVKGVRSKIAHCYLYA